MAQQTRKTAVMAAVPFLLVVVIFIFEACQAFALPAASPKNVLDRGGTSYPISAIAEPVAIKHIEPVADAEEFQRHVDSRSTQVLAVWFHASWCRKCKYVGARLRHLEEHLPPHVAKNVAVVSVDVNKVAKVPQRQGIKDLPTIQFFAGGKQVGSYVATDRGEVLYAKLERHILAAMSGGLS